jgi:5'-3' exonuclease
LVRPGRKQRRGTHERLDAAGIQLTNSHSVEQQTFFLLHLSLLREYLDLEFRDIEPALSFPYNLERIIDDFILFAVFVGNDFLPNLPDLHIHENGLEKLFNIYKRVLPSMSTHISLLYHKIIDLTAFQMDT